MISKRAGSAIDIWNRRDYDAYENTDVFDNPDYPAPSYRLYTDGEIRALDPAIYNPGASGYLNYEDAGNLFWLEYKGGHIDLYVKGKYGVERGVRLSSNSSADSIASLTYENGYVYALINECARAHESGDASEYKQRVLRVNVNTAQKEELFSCAYYVSQGYEEWGYSANEMMAIVSGDYVYYMKQEGGLASYDGESEPVYTIPKGASPEDNPMYSRA